MSIIHNQIGQNVKKIFEQAIIKRKNQTRAFRGTQFRSGNRVTLQTNTGVSMTEISGLIDMFLKRMMMIVVIVMMVMMMTMVVMVIRMMVVMITVVIREIIVGGGLAIRVPGSR